jgi:hypothetical protein
MALGEVMDGSTNFDCLQVSFPYDSLEGQKNHTLQQEIIRETPAGRTDGRQIRGCDETTEPIGRMAPGQRSGEKGLKIFVPRPRRLL